MYRPVRAVLEIQPHISDFGHHEKKLLLFFAFSAAAASSFCICFNVRSRL